MKKNRGIVGVILVLILVDASFFATFKGEFSIAPKSLIYLAINLAGIIYILFSRRMLLIIDELKNNRALIWKLSCNDFKTKYAGSYLGVIWGFAQPIITILIYWFIFELGFKSRPVKDYPFLLWLVAGLVPWFFFSEAIINATNSMIEYSYLVKKVVFKISIIPLVKVISVLFVHLFFMGFAVILFCIYGYYPDVYFLQIIYYSICMIVLVLGIGYITSAIMVFFKDLMQIISIFLQLGLWLTPILWDYSIMPEKYYKILKLNPMYYIVQGYRDSLINKVWFWERYNQTIYFWIIASGIFCIGIALYKKLKPHFADVL